MSQLVVLLPNGRRQTVKVTPNTTILEVIEQVCQNGGLAAEEYDLKHHRSILDSTSTVRFSALPQNAQLELVEAKQRRVESTVTLCLQLESGKRVQGECQPSATLWEAVEQIAPEFTASLSNPVVIYMRREVIGKDALASTSLRSIGLTGGRAAVRLIDRTLEELRVQANVSAPLTRPVILEVTEAPSNNTESHATLTVAPADKGIVTENKPGSEDVLTATPKILPEGEAMQIEDENNKDISNNMKDVTTVLSGEEHNMNIEDEKKRGRGKNEGAMQSSEEALQIKENSLPPVSQPKVVNESVESSADPVGGKRARSKSPEACHETICEKVILLGERNAVAYNLDTAPPAAEEDLPDDFYELTIADVRSLAAAARRAVRELEECPMVTSAQRKMDQDGLILQKLSQHKACIVRVRFPDRTVLQGCFKPIETVGAVREFVKGFLQDPSLNFYLYTTPPKEILNEETRLVEADCVPSAILYLGLPTPDQDRPLSFLREDVLDKFSSPAAASQTASQLLETDRKTSRPFLPKDDRAIPSTSKAATPGPSTSADSQGSNTRAPTAAQRNANPTAKNLPKWLKLGK